MDLTEIELDKLEAHVNELYLTVGLCAETLLDVKTAINKRKQELNNLIKPDVMGSAEYRCPNPRINSFTGRCESCGKWHTLEADL